MGELVERIPVAGPWITQREIDYVADAAAHAWYANANMYHARFEAAFAAHTGRRFACALPSCTAGLHLALLALGVGPGDQVIVPDITWIASSAPISYVGATPVFADIDPLSWCLDARSFESCITPRTKAVIVVDLYGNIPDMDAILDVARRRGVAVIEDAAEGIGAVYKGRPAGSFGDASAFSFHGSKTLTTGEGGMLLWDDEARHQRVLVLRDHGRQPGDRMFLNSEVAYKYKMSSLQAALGLAQLERIHEIVARKREQFDWYREELGHVEGLALNHEAPGVTNSYWMFTAVLDPSYGLEKAALMELLGARGMDARPFFHPLSSIPAYRGTPEAEAARARNHVAHRISPYGINLPSALALTRAQAAYVGRQLRKILAGARR